MLEGKEVGVLPIEEIVVEYRSLREILHRNELVREMNFKRGMVLVVNRSSKRPSESHQEHFLQYFPLSLYFELLNINMLTKNCTDKFTQ
jgi:hypothetical protein